MNLVNSADWGKRKMIGSTPQENARRTMAPEQARILYDGNCRLCMKSVALLKRLDWLHRLAYIDARQPFAVDADPRLQPARLLEEMHLITPDGARVYHGFRAFRWLAWRLPLLWPLAPFLYIPGAATLGQRAYLWVARNRFRLVPCHGGVCTLPPPAARMPEPSRPVPQA